ncbi:hypothetical protein [Haliscomenobacter sp.]|uniref:hypothetical protein n=1 Tax=Haliscomenobacter sp. TaxID=2717303 RepID=UPI003BAB9592
MASAIVNNIAGFLILAFMAIGSLISTRNYFVNIRNLFLEYQYSITLASFFSLSYLFIPSVLIFCFYEIPEFALFVFIFGMTCSPVILVPILVIENWAKALIFKIMKTRALKKSTKEYCLLLRSFNVKINMHAPSTEVTYYSQRPSDLDGEMMWITESATISGYSIIPYIYSALKKNVQLTALGEEKEVNTFERDGIYYLPTSDMNWREVVLHLCAYSKYNLFILSDSKGVLEELEMLKNDENLLKKTIFFLPPILTNVNSSNEYDFYRYWKNSLNPILIERGLEGIDYHKGGVMFMLNANGELKNYTLLKNNNRFRLSRDIKRAIESMPLPEIGKKVTLYETIQEISKN